MKDWRADEARNEARFRVQNEWTSQAPASFAEAGASASFICECGDDDCDHAIELTRAEYEQVRSQSTHFAVERDHENPESEVVISECARFAVVSKIQGAALRIARASDPRSDGTSRRAANVTDEVGTVTITHADGNGTWLVLLEGEHDTFTAPLLIEQTDHLWQICSRAVVDLSGARFIDSSVIHWLRRAKTAIDAHGSGEVVIIEAPGCFASRVLDVTGRRAEFPSYPTLAAALAPAPAEAASDHTA